MGFGVDKVIYPAISVNIMTEIFTSLITILRIWSNYFPTQHQLVSTKKRGCILCKILFKWTSCFRGSKDFIQLSPLTVRMGKYDTYIRNSELQMLRGCQWTLSSELSLQSEGLRTAPIFCRPNRPTVLEAWNFFFFRGQMLTVFCQPPPPFYIQQQQGAHTDFGFPSQPWCSHRPSSVKFSIQYFFR